MKRSFIIGLLLAATAAFPLASMAQVHVNGYTKKDGTYVAPHYRSNPNSTKLDNYSTRGNVNPYTGQVGTKDPYASPYTQPRYDSNQPSTYQPSQYDSSIRAGSDDDDH